MKYRYTSAPRKVGIWGWFQTGNYGDELMALYVAEAYRQIGVECVVFGLRPELSLKYGIAATDEVDDFFAQIGFCVFAEGGCLVDTGDSGNEKGERYVELATAARRHGVAVYPFSIGGNGQAAGKPKGGLGELWSDGTFRETVVRLPGDVGLIESFGGDANCVPDMLWEASRVLDCEVPRKRSETLRVGVNFLRRLVPENFCEWVQAAVPEGVEIHWLAVHTEDRVKGELRAEVETDRVKIFRHRDPLELLRFLGKLDVIVSSKLHVGLTGISQGATFLSCCGRPKTHAQLGEVSKNLIREERPKELLQSVFARPAEFLKIVPWDRVDELRDASSANRDWLQRWAWRHRLV
ncbi:MAG: hypothetical protein ACI8XO_000200 [Verrucomicrobiales bacterium]